MKTVITTLLTALTLSACVATPPAPPQNLRLNASQQTNLRTLLNLTPSSPFSVAVQDKDANQQLSAGDIAILYGGIANAETSRRTLSPADVATINIDDKNVGKVMCTMEAKLCPDGVTYVGRSGSHCEFAACPK